MVLLHANTDPISDIESIENGRKELIAQLEAEKNRLEEIKRELQAQAELQADPGKAKDEEFARIEESRKRAQSKELEKLRAETKKEKSKEIAKKKGVFARFFSWIGGWFKK